MADCAILLFALETAASRPFQTRDPSRRLVTYIEVQPTNDASSRQKSRMRYGSVPCPLATRHLQPASAAAMFSPPSQASAAARHGGKRAPCPRRRRRPMIPSSRMRLALDTEDWDTIIALATYHKHPFDDARTRTPWAANPLQLASARANLPAVQALLAANADPNSRNAAGASPLWLATAAGAASIAADLIAAGADVDAPDSAGWTPLCVAVGFGDVRSARALLAAGARVGGAERGAAPLALAARAGDEAMVRLLLEAGAAVDAANKAGVRPLFFAAQSGSVGALETLLAAGADPQAKLSDRSDALYAAAQGGAVDAVQVLLNAGARADGYNRDGAGPVSALGCCPGRMRFCRVSTHCGEWFCAFCLSALRDWVQLFIACQRGHAAAVQLLLAELRLAGCTRFAASVNAADVDGATPLFAASQNGHADVVHALFQGGGSFIEVNRANFEGATPVRLVFLCCSAYTRGSLAWQ
jgi:ankyrin repeat protein